MKRQEGSVPNTGPHVFRRHLTFCSPYEGGRSLFIPSASVRSSLYALVHRTPTETTSHPFPVSLRTLEGFQGGRSEFLVLWQGTCAGSTAAPLLGHRSPLPCRAKVAMLSTAAAAASVNPAPWTTKKAHDTPHDHHNSFYGGLLPPLPIIIWTFDSRPPHPPMCAMSNDE